MKNLKNRKGYLCALSWLCAVVLCLVTVCCPVKKVAASSLSDPTIEEDSSMTAGQKVTYDCVWFGTYPQTEVVSENDTTQIAALTEMNTYYDTKFETISASKFQKIVNADYDANGDATVDGVKYRRMKKGEALYTADENTTHYKWTDSTSYHYFKHEPVKWRVLKVSGDTALLLSDVALDDQKYNTVGSSITWEKSTIRSWLNNYGSSINTWGANYSASGFLKTAFTSTEQAAIANSSVENADNLTYGTEGGNYTTDKIFLLSESEVYSTATAMSYGFVKSSDTYDEARRAEPSTYAYGRGAYRTTSTNYAGNCIWWLRSPGDDSDRAAKVRYDGLGYDYRGYVSIIDSGVRPALYLNLSSTDTYFYAGTVCTDGTVDETTAEKNSSGEKEVFPTQSGNGNGSGNNSGSSGTSAETQSLTQTITAASKTVALKSKVRLNAKASGGGKLSYTSSNKKIATVTSSGKVKGKKYGKVTITIKAAANGRYKAATRKITVTVVPKQGKLKSVSSSAQKTGKLSWKKDKSVTGYEIQISQKKNFKKYTLSRTFKAKVTQTSLFPLQSKTKYYVRIRSYKKVGKKKYYGSWSKVKSVKIK